MGVAKESKKSKQSCNCHNKGYTGGVCRAKGGRKGGQGLNTKEWERGGQCSSNRRTRPVVGGRKQWKQNKNSSPADRVLPAPSVSKAFEHWQYLQAMGRGLDTMSSQYMAIGGSSSLRILSAHQTCFISPLYFQLTK